MKDTAVKFLIDEISCRFIISEELRIAMYKVIEMEKEQSHKYAEFAISCDRLEMKILNFEDWIKLQTFKSE